MMQRPTKLEEHMKVHHPKTIHGTHATVLKVFPNRLHDGDLVAKASTLVQGMPKRSTQDNQSTVLDPSLQFRNSALISYHMRWYYVKLQEKEKNRKLNDLLDALEFNQAPRQRTHS
eukprot:2711881-Amphidinium_carterae.1